MTLSMRGPIVHGLSSNNEITVFGNGAFIDLVHIGSPIGSGRVLLNNLTVRLLSMGDDDAYFNQSTLLEDFSFGIDGFIWAKQSILCGVFVEDFNYHALSQASNPCRK